MSKNHQKYRKTTKKPTKISKNHQKCGKTGPKPTKICQNHEKYPKITKNDQNC